MRFVVTVNLLTYNELKCQTAKAIEHASSTRTGEMRNVLQARGIHIEQNRTVKNRRFPRLYI
jgi:hypothetical protein